MKQVIRCGGETAIRFEEGDNGSFSALVNEDDKNWCKRVLGEHRLHNVAIPRYANGQVTGYRVVVPVWGKTNELRTIKKSIKDVADDITESVMEKVSEAARPIEKYQPGDEVALV